MNIENIIIYFVIVIFCLFMSGMFSAYETSLTWINRHRLKSLAKQKSRQGKSATIVYRFKQNFTTSLTIILIWNNIFNIVATTLLNLAFVEIFASSSNIAAATTTAIAISTILIIIFGEIIPKNFAFRYAETFALKAVYLLVVFKYLTYPLVFLVQLVSKKIIKATTEGDVIEVLDSSESEGIFEHHEKELVKAAIQIKEKIVSESMVPWSKVHTIRAHPSSKEILQILNDEHHYSRIPVLNQSKSKVLGILKIKDLYRSYMLNKKFLQEEDIELENYMKAPIFVKEDNNLLEVMELLQTKQIHLAIVTSQIPTKETKISHYVGIITLEDVLEELVGEIYDEHDEIEYNEPVTKINLDSFLIRGEADFKTIFDNHLDETNTPGGDFRSFHGWISTKAGGKPITKNFILTHENLNISVEKITSKYVVYRVEEGTPMDNTIEEDS